MIVSTSSTSCFGPSPTPPGSQRCRTRKDNWPIIADQYQALNERVHHAAFAPLKPDTIQT